MKITRYLKTAIAIGCMAALTVTGVALAGGSATAPPKASDETATAVDNDTLQQGDQNADDDATEAADATEVAGAADTDNVQEGDQTGADDKAEAADSEQAGSEADGPGGHADAGNEASVDHQFEGNE